MISMYLKKLTSCKDEFESVRVVTVDDDVVSLELLDLPKS